MEARRLPWPIRRLLRPVRNPQLVEGVLHQIERDVLLACGYKEPDLLVRQVKLHDADRDAVLDRLAADRTYLERVRKLTHRARRVAHLEWVHRSDREVLPEYIPTIRIPESGIWHVREDLDIGTAPYLESMPDEVAIGLVQELVERVTCNATHEAWMSEMGIDEQVAMDIGLGDDSKVEIRVLVIGAGPCTVAHAIDAVDDPLVKFRIVEVEPVPSERETLCVEARHEDLGPVLNEGDQYDAVVLHLPAPVGPGGGRHRWLYYEPDLFGIPALDLARLEPTKWMAWAERLIQVMPLLVRDRGFLHIYSPCGVRTRRSYDEHPGLRVAVTAALQATDLEAHRDIEVVPDGSTKQAFVSQARCSWRLISGTVNHKDHADA